MMKITTLEVSGIWPAMVAMRNPMNSWDRTDTNMLLANDYDLDDDYVPILQIFSREKLVVGNNDKTLSMKLQKAGPEHCKHLRMVMCWADIEAPRYWWNEFDTYRAGVEKVSCSTMHKLTSRPIELEDFEFDAEHKSAMLVWIRMLNLCIERYKEKDIPSSAKNAVWRELIQSLPQSYIQKRTVMMSYAALRNIVRQREGHKLKEWKQFIDWARNLPESWMIFDEE